MLIFGPSESQISGGEGESCPQGATGQPDDEVYGCGAEAGGQNAPVPNLSYSRPTTTEREEGRRLRDYRASKVQKLEDELSKSKKRHQYYQNLCISYRTQREGFKKGYNEEKETVAKQKLEISELRDAEAKRELEVKELTDSMTKKTHRITQLEETIKDCRHHITELEAAAERDKHHITELTGTISRSAQRIATTTRDDDFFEVEFASLASAIHQWVFRNFDFRDVPEDRKPRLRDLQLTVLESLRVTTLGFDATRDAKINRKEIEAVIIERLCNQIFKSDFVFKIYRLPYPPVHAILGGTDREQQRWHAQTVNMVTRNKDFNDRFENGVKMVAKDLQGCFDHLSKPDSQEARNKALYTITEQAARLELEIYRQEARFQLFKIIPGSKFLSWLMEDRSGVAGNEEEDESEETENYIVQTVLFPPVVRWEFDEAGSYVEPGIVVRKGIVIAIEAEIEQPESL